jgi:atypical dual specificity phosphatase
MNTFEKTTLFTVALMLFIGCGESRKTAAPDQPAPSMSASEEDSSLIPPTEGFSWVVTGELAAMPLPGKNRPLYQDVAFLEEEGIHVVVSLTEELPESGPFEQGAIRQVHIPITDFTAPTLEQMIEFVDVVTTSAENGEPTAVHCTAGLGRSGTMSAAYLVASGLSAEDAIARVRELRPGSIETDAQEEAVRQAEAHFSTRH